MELHQEIGLTAWAEGAISAASEGLVRHFSCQFLTNSQKSCNNPVPDCLTTVNHHVEWIKGLDLKFHQFTDFHLVNFGFLGVCKHQLGGRADLA